MRVFIIVAAFTLAQAYGNAIGDDRCDEMHLKQCADKFEKAIGLDPMTRDVNVIDRQIKKLEAEGKQNQVCNAAKVLETCLGTEYNACISVKYLESVGVPEADAKKFVAITQQLQKQCSRINFAIRNDQCDGMHYSKCADLFAADLHLGLHMPKLQVVNKQIKDLEAKGLHEHLQLCNARLFLETCLGPDYKGCVSVEYFKSIGEPETDAKEFITLMQDLKKQCNQVNFASNPTCDPTLFTKCTDSFAQALGLPSMPKNATVLFFQIVKITFSSPQGEGQVCNAAGNLHSCLGQQYSSCISVEFLESTGISANDAKEFVEISQTLEKECAQKFYLNVINAQCDLEHFKQCGDTFAKGLGLPRMPKDPSVLDRQVKTSEAQGKVGVAKVCTAEQGLQKCLGQQYDTCISVAYLKSIGVSDADANKFVAISQELETRCPH